MYASNSDGIIIELQRFEKTLSVLCHLVVIFGKTYDEMQEEYLNKVKQQHWTA